MVSKLFLIVALILVLYILWAFLCQILFVAIMAASYFIFLGLFYEKTIGQNYSDDKKICLNIFNVVIKIPNDVNITRENNYYKFKKNDIGHFLYLFTSVFTSVFIFTSIFLAPSVFSVMFFLKAILIGFLLSCGTHFIVSAHCEHFDNITYN